VRVLDAHGNGADGVEVVWTVVEGDGSVDPGSSTTDGAGNASTSWTVGQTAGENTLRAEVADLDPVMFTATGGGGAPFALAKVSGDQEEGVPGSAVELVVRVTDEFGNPVRAVSVTWSVTEGGGAADPGTVNTDEAGQAETTWRFAGDPGEHRLEATVQGLDAAIFTADVHGYEALTAGPEHTCGLSTAGAAYCWGQGEFGQLGDGTFESRTTPVAVAGGLSFVSLSAGFTHTCGVADDGTAYCWGWSDEGELGTGSVSQSPVPLAVAGGLAFAAIAAGEEHTCALRADGTAYCWGSGDSGQLGHGSNSSTNVPEPVEGDLAFEAIAVGSNHSCALATDGTPYCWGSDTGTDVPVPVAIDAALVSISASVHFTCGIATDGAGYCWGIGGPGPAFDAPSNWGTQDPTELPGGRTFASLSTAGWHACGVTTVGDTFCRWWNYAGQLGDGSTTDSVDDLTQVAGGHAFTSVAAGFGHTCAMTADGSAYCWGSGSVGQLGTGSETSSPTPVRVGGPPGQ
jgi:alpha-tubulin suppressor-like RCC1 family protein